MHRAFVGTGSVQPIHGMCRILSSETATMHTCCTQSEQPNEATCSLRGDWTDSLEKS